MYDGWSITLFNIIFTGLPIIVYGIFEKDVTPGMVRRYPQLYEDGQKKHDFSIRLLLYWLCTGIYQAFVIFFGMYLVYKYGLIQEDGKSTGMLSLGNLCYFAVICTVAIRLALEIRFWTVFHYIAVIGCVLIWFPWIGIVSGSETFITDGFMYRVGFHLFQGAVFWLAVLCFTVLCDAPSLAIEYYRREYYPKNNQVVQEIQRLQRRGMAPKDVEMEEVQSVPPKQVGAERKNSFTGFAFAPDNNPHEAIDHKHQHQNTSQKDVKHGTPSLRG